MRRMSRQDCVLVKIEPDAEIIVKFLIISLVILWQVGPDCSLFYFNDEILSK